MARLFSKHHDQFHVHKVLGFSVLFHFLYRAHVLVTRGVAFPPSESFTSLLFWLTLHVLLNTSSFAFALPAKRNPLAPMIWPAYRAHNAIFATRNAVGALLMFAAERRGLLLSSTIFSSSSERDVSLFSALFSGVVSRGVARALFVCLSMAAADAVTRHYDNGEATTRGIPYFPTRDAKALKVVKSFYMQCQFHATLLSVTEPTLSFFCVLPIQVASFGMTLARKKKISSFAWHVLYAVSLWSVYAFILCRPVATTVAAAGILAGVAKEVRQHLRVNKYLLWVAVVALHEYLTSRVLPTLPTSGPAQTLAFWLMFLAASRYVYRLGAVFLSVAKSDHLQPEEEEEEVAD